MVHLRIDYDQLHNATANSEKARSAIEGTGADLGSIDSSVGHRNLGGVMGSFAGSWSVHRTHLLAEVETLRDNLAAARRDFEAVDTALAGTTDAAGATAGTSSGTPTAPGVDAQAPATASPGGSPEAPRGHEVPDAPVTADPATLDPGDQGAGTVPAATAAATLRPPTTPGASEEVADLFADIDHDGGQFQSLLEHWADEATRLDHLGLSLSALGAGTLAVLSMYGKLPAGYTYQPDGTVIKSGAGVNRPRATSAISALDQVGPKPAGETAPVLTAGEASELLEAGDKGGLPQAPEPRPTPPEEAGDPRPQETAEGVRPVTPSEVAGAVGEQPEPRPMEPEREGSPGTESGAPQPGAPGRPETTQGGGHGDSGTRSGEAGGGAPVGTGGMPLPPPPPAAAASEALSGSGFGGSGGSAPAAVVGSTAASAAALSAVASPGSGSGPAATSHATGAASTIAPHVAAMGSLSPLNHPGGGGSGSALGGVATAGAPGSAPAATTASRGEGSGRARAAKEALDRLAADGDGKDDEE